MTPEKLRSLGYTVLPISPNSKVPSIKNWQLADPDEIIATGWSSPQHGHGIRCGDRNVTALDVDIYDAEVIQKMNDFIELKIGPYVSRVGMAPKTLIPVVCPELAGKRVSKRFRNPVDNTVNALEILSVGNQFIHTGIHPDTLMPYTWDAEIPAVKDLPVVTLAQIDEMFDFFEMLALAKSWMEIVKPKSLNRKSQTPLEFRYNSLYHVTDLLTQYGWKPVSEGSEWWTRPGKQAGVSGTVTENTFYCFTSSSMLEPDTNHRPYDIVLAHAFNGDGRVMDEHVVEVTMAHAATVFANPPITLPPTVPVDDSVTRPAMDIPYPTPDDVSITPKPKLLEGTPGVITTREGPQWLTAEGQIAWFKDCVYVTDVNRILVKHGMMLDQSQFKARYGGYDFAMDSNMDKMTDDAWKAFTNSKVVNFPKVDHICFSPRYPFGHISTDSLGHTEVNIFIPPNVASVPGDVTPYLNHIVKMIPDPHDRAKLMAYMAAVVQYPGVKFQWGPLVQGVQGNGKSLLTRCLKEAVGARYCHSPNASDISNKFNAWYANKILIIIEEIAVGQKYEIMEILKPMITQGTIEIQGKGKDQIIIKVCGNFFFNSNHKDALIKTRDDRRYCIFFTAQQSPGDLVRDGMDGDYFYNIYEWLKAGGYANVTHYLQNYEIPDELNPATRCQRAPLTTSTTEAINFSFGKAEQEIINAIGEDRPGFMGGWISSMAIDKLFKERGINKARNRRKGMLADMGYVQHPALGQHARCNTKNLIDGGKTTLYVVKDHINVYIQGNNETTAAYVKAQGLEAPTRVTP